MLRVRHKSAGLTRIGCHHDRHRKTRYTAQSESGLQMPKRHLDDVSSEEHSGNRRTLGDVNCMRSRGSWKLQGLYNTMDRPGNLIFINDAPETDLFGILAALYIDGQTRRKSPITLTLRQPYNNLLPPLLRSPDEQYRQHE